MNTNTLSIVIRDTIEKLLLVLTHLEDAEEDTIVILQNAINAIEHARH